MAKSVSALAGHDYSEPMQGRSPAHAGRAPAGAVYAALLLALALPLTARAADAPPAVAPVPAAPELALTWQAPAGCPSSGDVEAQFARLLGGAARTPSGKHIAATLAVHPSSSERWTLELATVLDGAAGRRSLEGESCSSVASAAALILALMIDPAAASRAVAESAPPTPPPAARPPAPPPTVTAAPPPAPEAAPRTSRESAAYARVFAGGVASFLPTPVPATGLAVGARRRRFAVELSAFATEEHRADSSALPGSGGNFRLLAGDARVCGDLGGRVVVWQACLGGELERLSATGAGVDVSPQSKSALMGAGTGGLLVTLPLGSRLALSLDLDAVLRAYHPTVALDQTTPIFQVPVVSAFAALGIVINI